MATVVTLYIKPEFLAGVSPIVIDGTVNWTAQLISEKITVTSQVLFSLLPLKHFLAHSLSIQVTVNLPKTQLDINVMAALACWILCMVKTGERAAGVRHSRSWKFCCQSLNWQPTLKSQISLHSSFFPSNHSHSPSVRLCPVIHFFHTQIRRFKRSDWRENIIIIVALRHLTSSKSILAGLLNDIIMLLTVFGHWLSGQKWDDLSV